MAAWDRDLHHSALLITSSEHDYNIQLKYALVVRGCMMCLKAEKHLSTLYLYQNMNQSHNFDDYNI